MAAIPRDGLLRTATAIAEGRVRVHVPFLEMRDIEGLAEAWLDRSIGKARRSAHVAPVGFGTEAQAAEQTQRANHSRGDTPAKRSE